jgi:Integrase zinc binding domain
MIYLGPYVRSLHAWRFQTLDPIDGPYVLNNDNYKIIESVHNAMVGHGGVERTLRKLQDLKLTWKNMRLDVKTYIRECPCCQKMSQIKMEILHLYLIGNNMKQIIPNKFKDNYPN